jgi:hypothetical protein
MDEMEINTQFNKNNIYEDLVICYQWNSIKCSAHAT